MEIIEFYSLEDKAYWLSQIRKSDWRAGQYLYDLLSGDRLKALCGETTRVFLLTDNPVGIILYAGGDRRCEKYRAESMDRFRIYVSSIQRTSVYGKSAGLCI